MWPKSGKQSPDSQLGPYKLIARIGAGAMGAVYKAQHSETANVVALKLISAELLRDETAIQRFKREIAAVQALNHPNIVRAVDAGEHGGVQFLAMEFVEGKDLRRWAKEYGQLPIGFSCECIRQAATGLQHAHEQHVAHRDIKPSNVLVVVEEGAISQVKILDMGLARFTEDASTTPLTASDHIMGTLEYMAPEQVAKTKTADIRADIFSLGCTLFRLLAGCTPFTAATAQERLRRLMLGRPPSLTQFRSDVPHQLDVIVAKMLARDPEARYQLPAEVADELALFSRADDVPIEVSLSSEGDEDSSEGALRSTMQAPGVPQPCQPLTETQWGDVDPGSNQPTRSQPAQSAILYMKRLCLIGLAIIAVALAAWLAGEVLGTHAVHR